MLNDMPADLLWRICSYLSFEDVFRLCRVSRYVRWATSANNVWLYQFHRRMRTSGWRCFHFNDGLSAPPWAAAQKQDCGSFGSKKEAIDTDAGTNVDQDSTVDPYPDGHWMKVVLSRNRLVNEYRRKKQVDFEAALRKDAMNVLRASRRFPLQNVSYEVWKTLSNLKPEGSNHPVLLAGLDASGKTTILYNLKLGEVVTTIPTIGFNVETLTLNRCQMTLWDLGGGDKIRPLWRNYFENAQGVIFVVDSCDRDRMAEARGLLHELFLHDRHLEGCPFLIVANKQDLPHPMTVNEIAEGLNMAAATQPWYIHPSAATVPDDNGLREAMEWLAGQIQPHRGRKWLKKLFKGKGKDKEEPATEDSDGSGSSGLRQTGAVEGNNPHAKENGAPSPSPSIAPPPPPPPPPPQS